MAAAPDGAVWIGTRSHMLHRFKDGHYTTYGDREGLAAFDVHALCITRNGDVWMAERRPYGMQRLRQGRFQNFKLPPEIRVVQAIVEDPSGDVWSGSSSGLLMRFHGDEAIDESRRLPKITCAIRSVDADADGLWVGVGTGRGDVRCAVHPGGAGHRPLRRRTPLTGPRERKA